MNATRKAGALRQFDMTQVEHHPHAEGKHADGTPCYCDWDLDVIVDRQPHLVDGRLVALEWHTEDGICGVTVIDIDTNLPYLGRAAA